MTALSGLRGELGGSPVLVGAAMGGAAAVGAAAVLQGKRAPVIMGLYAGLVAGIGAERHRELVRSAANAGDSAFIAPWLDGTAVIPGGWAIEADFGRLVVQQVLFSPGTVVECGSGITTILVAKALRASGTGHLFSIDHDAEYAEKTRAQLRAASLESFVTIIVAPLEHQQIGGGPPVLWYDLEAIAAALPAETPVDLLIVDGPPAVVADARWPAVEVFADRLPVGAIVLADDGRRGDETRMAFRWQRDHPEFELSWYDTVKGTWRLKKQAEPIRRSRGKAAAVRVRSLLTPRPGGTGRWPVHR